MIFTFWNDFSYIQKQNYILMKKYSLLFLLLLTSILFYGQNNSIYGEVFTPKGELRALIIFAGFGSFDENQDFKNWPAENEFPN